MTKKPVTIRALTARLNRKLRKKDLKLVKYSPKWQSLYGEYMTIHLGSNLIGRQHVELESLARELKCLADYEKLED